MVKTSSKRRSKKMLREDCIIQIGLRISKEKHEQLKKYMDEKGINTEAGAARQIITEKLDEVIGRIN